MVIVRLCADDLTGKFDTEGLIKDFKKAMEQ